VNDGVVSGCSCFQDCPNLCMTVEVYWGSLRGSTLSSRANRKELAYSGGRCSKSKIGLVSILPVFLSQKAL
jgi:hypothetical protein